MPLPLTRVLTASSYFIKHLFHSLLSNEFHMIYDTRGIIFFRHYFFNGFNTDYQGALHWNRLPIDERNIQGYKSFERVQKAKLVN